MSTPFPLEEESQTDNMRPTWNPWNAPAKPSWGSGMGFTEDTAYLGPLYRIAAMPGAAAAKGELLMSGAMHASSAENLDVDDQGGLVATSDPDNHVADAIQSDAKMRLSALRPDPTTTGIAVQTLHSLGEGATTMLAGSAVAGPAGAFAALSSTEGYSSYQDLLDQGVKGEVAAKVASVRGVTAGLGAVMPMVFGAGLATRMLSGAAANTAFGVVNRELDSTILRSNGYGEMADQEQVFDRTQMLIDLAMGSGFGAIHHLTAEARPAADKLADAMANDSSLRDAALTANLALRDRKSGPGVPVTPGDANAHARALEKAVNDLQNRQPVDVSGTGVEDSTVIPRGGEPDPQLHEILTRVIGESGLLEETDKANQLEAALNRRLAGEPEPEASLHPSLKQEDLDRLEPYAQAQIKDHYDAAAAAKPQFDKALGDIAGEVGGQEKLAPLKGSGRAVDKIKSDYGGDASKIGDVLRGTVRVDDEAGAHRAVESIKSRFDVVKEKDRIATPTKEGYRDILLNVRTPSGHLAEIQVMTHAMGDAKDIAHKFYKERDTITRTAKGEDRQRTPGETARIAELDQKMRDTYAAAAEREALASSSNLAAEHEMPLRWSEDSSNRRGGETSNAKQSEPPSGIGTIATGMSSKSKNSVPFGRVAESRAGEPALGLSDMKSPPTGESVAEPGQAGAQGDINHEIAQAALQERPDMEIPGANGEPVRAADALAAVQKQVATTSKEAPSIFRAAINCFLRRGS